VEDCNFHLFLVNWLSQTTDGIKWTHNLFIISETIYCKITFCRAYFNEFCLRRQPSYIPHSWGDNLSRSNTIPAGRGERDWPIRILLPSNIPSQSHLTWHSGFKVVASVLYSLHNFLEKMTYTKLRCSSINENFFNLERKTQKTRHGQ
jgi:hypothetical protein